MFVGNIHFCAYFPQPPERSQCTLRSIYQPFINHIIRLIARTRRKHTDVRRQHRSSSDNLNFRRPRSFLVHSAAAQVAVSMTTSAELGEEVMMLQDVCRHRLTQVLVIGLSTREDVTQAPEVTVPVASYRSTSLRWLQDGDKKRFRGCQVPSNIVEIKV